MFPGLDEGQGEWVRPRAARQAGSLGPPLGLHAKMRTVQKAVLWARVKDVVQERHRTHRRGWPQGSPVGRRPEPSLTLLLGHCTQGPAVTRRDLAQPCWLSGALGGCLGSRFPLSFGKLAFQLSHHLPALLEYQHLNNSCLALLPVLSAPSTVCDMPEVLLFLSE